MSQVTQNHTSLLLQSNSTRATTHVKLDLTALWVINTASLTYQVYRCSGNGAKNQ